MVSATVSHWYFLPVGQILESFVLILFIHVEQGNTSLPQDFTMQMLVVNVYMCSFSHK